MSKKTSDFILLLLQIMILILEIIGFVIAISKHSMLVMGFYTQQSNLVMLMAAAVYVGFRVFGRGKKMPGWVMVLQYVATCMVTVTFVTVILVLIPMFGFKYSGYLLMDGANLYHHLLGPLLAALAFLVFEKEYRPTLAHSFIAAAPTLFYAILSTSLNIAKVVRGPYPFLYVYEQPWWMSVMWFVAIPTGAFLFALLFGFIKRKIMGEK